MHCYLVVRGEKLLLLKKNISTETSSSLIDVKIKIIIIIAVSFGLYTSVPLRSPYN